jgi:hypothetical protein
MTVQEDFDDLVVACWGRGLWILDDIAPIRQLTPDVLKSRAYLFDPRPGYLFVLRPPGSSESFATEFDPPSNAGHNPPYGADITYYLGSAPQSDVRLTISDDKGTVLRTLDGTKNVGLNRVWWNLRAQPPTQTAGRGGQQAGRAGGGGGGGGRGNANPQVAPGTYNVKLTVGTDEFTTRLQVRKDPALN